MKRWVISICIIVSEYSGVNAQDINIDEVKKVANNFFSITDNSKSLISEIEVQRFSKNDTDLIYLANNKKNFIFIANDLRVTPILGYTDEGSFDGENIPPQLLSLIESYKTEILSLKRGKSDYKRSYEKDWEQYLKSDFSSEKASVAPFITVKWNQGSGWNRFCPEDADGPGGRVYAGCVAVSMAQSMSVYEHPDVGVGESGYSAGEYGYLSANYGETEYNWDLMSETTSDDYNALLLYHCAVSV